MKGWQDYGFPDCTFCSWLRPAFALLYAVKERSKAIVSFDILNPDEIREENYVFVRSFPWSDVDGFLMRDSNRFLVDKSNLALGNWSFAKLKKAVADTGMPVPDNIFPGEIFVPSGSITPFTIAEWANSRMAMLNLLRYVQCFVSLNYNRRSLYQEYSEADWNQEWIDHGTTTNEDGAFTTYINTEVGPDYVHGGNYISGSCVLPQDFSVTAFYWRSNKYSISDNMKNLFTHASLNMSGDFPYFNNLSIGKNDVELQNGKFTFLYDAMPKFTYNNFPPRTYISSSIQDIVVDLNSIYRFGV